MVWCLMMFVVFEMNSIGVVLLLVYVVVCVNVGVCGLYCVG